MAQSAQSDVRGKVTRRVTWAVAFATWLGLSVFVLAALTSYASRAGAAADASSTVWPAASKLPKSQDRAALVMIAHTKCACTRASLRELEGAMARAHGRIDAFVLFVGPRESTVSSGLLDLRSTARAIPGVRVVEDENEAQLFGEMFEELQEAGIPETGTELSLAEANEVLDSRPTSGAPEHASPSRRTGVSRSRRRSQPRSRRSRSTSSSWTCRCPRWMATRRRPS